MLSGGDARPFEWQLSAWLNELSVGLVTHLVHPAPSTSHNDRRSRRHVEGVLSIATGSYDVADGALAVVANVGRAGVLLHHLGTRSHNLRQAILARQPQRS